MKRIVSFGLLLVVILVSPYAALAGPGKIAGKVVDQEGEPVIGASVQIMETQQGAPVGIDGNYVVLGVQPGTYTVRITCVGYSTQVHQSVRVSGDLTTTVNATLSEEALQLGEQIIQYKAPTVKLDVAAKEVRITGKEMETRAVTNIASLLKKQPGFKVDPEGGLHVRGGRSNEMLIKVDGVDFRDPLVSGSRQIVSLTGLNIEEIEVLTGGDASYGGFQSALINVTRPEGSMSDYSAVIEWRTDRAFQNSFHYAPWPGLNAGDYDPRFGVPDQPDAMKIPLNGFNTDQYDYSVAGPVPFLNKWMGGQKLSFFTSGMVKLTNTYTPYAIKREDNDYLGVGLDIPERQNNDYQTFWKLTYRPDRTRKLNLSYQRDFLMWDIYPDGEDARDGNTGWQYKYNVANRPFCKTSRQSVSLAFSHNVTKNTLYEVTLSNFNTTTKIQPRGKSPDEFTLFSDVEDDDRNTLGAVDQNQNGYLDGYVDANRNGQYDGEGEGYDDVNENGQWDRGEDWVDLDGDGVYDDAEPWVDRASPDGVNNVGVWDPWDPYQDLNGNGRWDAAEPQLAEQDWNHNGRWDGERFNDANGNHRYDGWGEGYDDKNNNGRIDRRELFNAGAEVNGEPFVDGDFWYDTGEPFVDSPDENGFYNGVYDDGEIYYDLPSSYRGPFAGRVYPAPDGQYNGPNGVFDEYELFTYPAVLEFGMDSKYPVLYTWEDIRGGIRNGGQEWLGIDYLAWIDGKSTWTNVTMGDEAAPVFDMPDFMWDPGREPFTDYNGNGRQDALPDFFLNPGQWDQDAFWMHRESKEYSGKMDLTSQLNKSHELKAGVELKYRILRMNSITRPDRPYTFGEVPLPDDAPYPDRGGSRDFYEHKPWEGAVYVQDKMEFEGLIAKAGLRTDFVIQPNNLIEETQAQLDRNQPGALLAKRGRFVLAPRLGISHPVSTRSKLYFNYGHYYQAPAFTYYYRAATSNFDPAAATQIGNPNLEYEKTVSYEVGVNTEFAENWVIDLAGYYRDVYNQIGTIETREGAVRLARYYNLGYGRCRGVEISLEKKFSDMWAVTTNYTFAYAYGKESSAVEGLLQRTSNQPENRDEHPLDWDQTHSVNAFVTLMISDKDKPRPFGIRIPNDWLSTLEVSYGTGLPYTPSEYTTGRASNLILANSARAPDVMTVDLKFDKFWNLTGKIRLATGVEIYNLLDRRNARGVFTSTGNSYDSSHERDITARDDYNQGVDYDHNPRNWYPPRQILLHFKLSV